MPGHAAAPCENSPTLPAALALEAAIEASQVCVTIADMSRPDGPLSFVNQAFLDTTGYTHGEVVGRNCRFLQGPETDPAAVNAMGAAIAARRALQIDILNYRKDGEAFVNALHLSPVSDSEGELIAYIGVQHDVTEQRAARAAEQHRQKIEALGRMAGGLAHELNNLLQPLVTLPELVAQALPADACEARDDLAVMRSSAMEARALVADMLGYTRARPVDGGAINALDASRRALALITRSLNGEVSLAFEPVQAENLTIAGLSAPALQQVLTNLVLNAAHAIAWRGQIRVRLSAGPEGGARLEVLDAGCGMDETVRARLFEPFFTTRPAGQGAGLGLHIVFDLVRQAGGCIDVQSAPGEGARFILDFPPAGGIEHRGDC